MSELPDVYWTLQVRGRGEQQARALQSAKPSHEPLLFGSPPPEPEPERFVVRYRAVMRAITELMAGAEAIEITRFPPLKTTTKTTTQDPE